GNVLELGLDDGSLGSSSLRGGGCAEERDGDREMKHGWSFPDPPLDGTQPPAGTQLQGDNTNTQNNQDVLCHRFSVTGQGEGGQTCVNARVRAIPLAPARPGDIVGSFSREM